MSRGRPHGSRDYQQLILSDKQKSVEAFLEMAIMGERCYYHPDSRYLSTRNIGRWPFPVQPENWVELAAGEKKYVRIRCGVDEFDCLIRVYPKVNISKKDFMVAWRRVGGMGWRTLRRIDGRTPDTLRLVYKSVLDDLYKVLQEEEEKILKLF